MSGRVLIYDGDTARTGKCDESIDAGTTDATTPSRTGTGDHLADLQIYDTFPICPQGNRGLSLLAL